MIVDTLKDGNTIIEFDDEFIIEEKTETRRLDLEVFIFNIMKCIINDE